MEKPVLSGRNGFSIHIFDRIILMNTTKETGNDTHILVNNLSGRYGRLALTRAAGEAAAAERSGDRERSALWRNVVVHLRQSMGEVQITAAS